jgi:hypothetical protein
VPTRAELIVIGDGRHLLPIGVHQSITISEAAEALRRLAG